MADSHKPLFPTWPELRKQVLLTLICFPLAAALSFVGQGVLKRTHVLDSTTEWLSSRVMSVDTDLVAWVVALVVSLALYALVVWKVWRLPHINHYHRDFQVEAKPAPSLQLELNRADPVGEKYELADEALDGLQRVLDGVTEAQKRRPPAQGEFLDYLLRKGAEREDGRDTPLGEALLYVLKGSWGSDFSSFDPRADSYGLDTRKWELEEKAEEGKIQVWGSDLWVDGRYTKIKPNEWENLKIDWQSLIEGKPRTTARNDDSPPFEPRYNMMVNKAQIEREFPRSEATPTAASTASYTPKSTEEHPLQAAVKAKAQLMRDRLSTRNHIYGDPRYDTPRTTSYLAAMWDAEERGHFYDEYHRSTFMPMSKGAPNDLPGDTIAELQRNVIQYKEKRRQANLAYQRRRELIDKGRDVVTRFRAEQPSVPFETWARRQREYLDIQPHLGDEYQKWVIRNADGDVSSIADGEFLRELARLAKEWNLE
jgi:hypothetical protein